MNKLFKSTVCAVAAVAMMVTCFAGCSKKDDTAADTSSSEQKEVLVMATNATFPPYEYYDGEDIVGIDAEIGKAIADKLGMDFKIEDMEFNSIISYVNNGDNVMGMAGMTVSEDRKLQVDFSSSYANGVQVVIVKKGSDIKTVDDLAGKKIGVQLSTTGDIYATDDFGAEMVTQYNKATDCVLGLKNGDVDAVIIDNAPAQTFVAENDTLKLLETEYANEDYAICVKKGNTQLLDKINGALNELTADGTVKKIIDKYIPAK